MKGLLFPILLLFPTLILSQNRMADVTYPAPSTHEFVRWDQHQPNLYTGLNTIDIPLHAIDFESWVIPLALHYATNGIRTNQEASEVGLGWSLKATAVVTRNVKINNDFADTQYGKGYVLDQEDYFDKLKKWKELDFETERAALDNKMKHRYIDTEPDLFSYSFFGYNGHFVLSKKNTSTNAIKVIKLKEDGVIIEFDFSKSHFTIATPNGFKGYFTLKERSTNLSKTIGNQSFEEDLNNDQVQYNGSQIDFLALENRANLRVITAWYLEKIESPKGKTLQFSYNIVPDGKNDHIAISRPHFGQRTTDDKDISFSRQIHEHVYLTKIVYDNVIQIAFLMADRDDVERNFIKPHLFTERGDETKTHYTANGPELVAMGKNLQRYTGVEIKGHGTAAGFSKKITFYQSYFNANFTKKGTNSVYQNLRLRLDSLTLGDQHFGFDYYTYLDKLPQKSTKGIDYFGTYNGQDSNQRIAPVGIKSTTGAGFFLGKPIACTVDASSLFAYFFSQRTAKLETAKAGSLSKITYPYGGYATFDYELNTLYTQRNTAPSSSIRPLPLAADASGNFGKTLELGGLRIAEIKKYDAKEQLVGHTTYDYVDEQGNSSGQLLNPFVVLDTNYFKSASPFCTVVFDPQPTLFGLPMAQGNSLGYSRVVAHDWDQGKNAGSTTYSFYNKPLGLSNRVAALAHHSQRNGKLIEHTQKNAQQALVQHVEHILSEEETLAASGVNYYVSPPPNNLPLVFPYQYLSTGGEVLTSKSKAVFNGRNLEHQQTYTYNSIKQRLKQEEQSSSKQNISKTTKRLLDYPKAHCSGCVQESMLQKNQVDMVLEEIEKVDAKVVAAQGYRYGISAAQDIVLQEIFEYNREKGAFVNSPDGVRFPPPYESRITFVRHDTHGNPLEQHPTAPNAPHTVTLWGYAGQYAIAEIKNATFAEVQQALGLSGNQEPNETHLNAINALRSSKTQWMITTYEHLPLVGIKNITQPNGTTTHFEYDTQNRLQYRKDHNQQVVEEYVYHYRGTPVTPTNPKTQKEKEKETEDKDKETQEPNTSFKANPKNPYSVANMKKAFNSLNEKNKTNKKTYTGKIITKESSIVTTHYYVRFWVENEEQQNHLLNNELELSPIPLDYLYTESEIKDLEQTLEASTESGQWVYTVVPDNHSFLPKIQYEIIETLFLPEPAYTHNANSSTQKTAGLDQTFLFDLEDTSLALTDYDAQNKSSTTAKRSKSIPEGHIYVMNTAKTQNSVAENGGATTTSYKEPVVDIIVKARHWFKWAKGWTNSDGHYKLDRGFRRDPRYTLAFKNKIGFKVRYNIISFSSGRYHAGRHSKKGYTVSFATDSKPWRLATVNNATVKYFNYCEQLGISKPLSNLRIQAHTFGGGGGSAPMLRRISGVLPLATAASGAVYWMVANKTPLTIKITTAISLLANASKLVLPDIMINANNPARDTEEVYESVFHELGHASHYQKVGHAYWHKYIVHIATNKGYGKGSENNAGYTGVGEMWGYYISAIMTSTEFNEPIHLILDEELNWYNPGFLYDVVTEIEDLSIKDVFSCLTPTTTSIKKLVAALKTKTKYDTKIDEIYAKEDYEDWPEN